MKVFIAAINDLQVGGMWQSSFTRRLCVCVCLCSNPGLQLRGNWGKVRLERAQSRLFPLSSCELGHLAPHGKHPSTNSKHICCAHMCDIKTSATATTCRTTLECCWYVNHRKLSSNGVRLNERLGGKGVNKSNKCLVCCLGNLNWIA